MAKTETTTQGGLRPARRTIVKGAAWAVPAIAIAAPAMAAGLSQPIIPVGCGNACKHPGNPKYYHFIFCFTNTSDVDIIVNVTDMIINGVTRDAFVNCPPGEAGCTAGGQSFVVPANTTRCKHVDAGTYEDSANGAATLTWSFIDPVTAAVVPGTPVSAGTLIGDGLPPCDDPVKKDPPHAIPNPSSCGDDIAGEEPAAKTTVEAPAVEAPAVEEPAVEAPAVEAPAVEAPAVEEPAVEAPAVDTAETTAGPQG